MRTSLDSLPLDLTYEIALRLHLEDTIHLSQTCRSLSYALSEPTLCRFIVNSEIAHTSEARLARQGTITYQDAAARVFGRREAFSSANPTSAAVLGYGSAFLYQGGILAYRAEDTIRILDLHASGCTEQVIDLPQFLDKHILESQQRSGTFNMLNLSENILVCLYETGKPANDAYIIAFRFFHDGSGPLECLVISPVESTAKLFARNNSTHVWFGTHSEMNLSGHHEWLITGISLLNKDHPPNKIRLENFVGNDIGQTVYFDINKDFFYALSNQTSFDVEEVDWTSNYHLYRFPVQKPKQQDLRIYDDIWRRNHIEGPINDSWTDLRLETDEQTGDLMIVEARREWQNGGSSSQRTYYTQPLNFLDDEPDQGPPEEGEPLALPADNTPGPYSDASIPAAGSHAPSETASPPNSPVASTGTGIAPYVIPSHFPDDPLTRLLEPGDKPSYSAPRYRAPANVHPGSDTSAGPSFILAKTKLRYYNRSCHTYLDLVDDPENPPRCSSTGSHPGIYLQQRLRLRVGSRQRDKPLRKPEDGLLIPETKDWTGNPQPGSNEGYIDRGPPRMWPPQGHPPAPEPLHPDLAAIYDILNPVPGLREGAEVHGVADERSIVYMTGTPGGPGHGFANYTANGLGLGSALKRSRAVRASAEDKDRNNQSGDPRPQERAIVFINFDRGITLPGLQRLGCKGIGESPANPGRAAGRSDPQLAGATPPCSATSSRASSPTASSTAAASPGSTLSTDEVIVGVELDRPYQAWDTIGGGGKRKQGKVGGGRKGKRRDAGEISRPDYHAGRADGAGKHGGKGPWAREEKAAYLAVGKGLALR